MNIDRSDYMKQVDILPSKSDCYACYEFFEQSDTTPKCEECEPMQGELMGFTEGLFETKAIVRVKGSFKKFPLERIRTRE